ncbi:unnamed protein product [Orchesella dallaii]|uniref:Phosphoinositide phospholipase C n=1 Tax=Orchesella dallaii TaxID=48710 RepID=A0ABP1S012_9HEXA
MVVIYLTPADILANSKELEDVLKSLNQDGSHLWKVRGASKWFRRKFLLDINEMAVKYEPTSKSSCFQKQKKNIDLSEIKEIRRGWQTDTFNKVEQFELKRRAKKADGKSSVDEKACFSIIYGPRNDTWDLIAPTIETAEKWVRVLQHLVSLYRSQDEQQSYERWLRKQFNSADMDKNKCLSLAETMKLLKNLNIRMDEDDANKLFHEANTRKASGKNPPPEVLDEEEFVAFYFKLLRRPEIQDLFDKYATNGSLTASKLCQFLREEQGEDPKTTTDEECNNLIKIYEKSGELRNKGEMSLTAFVKMLLSPRCDIFDNRHKTVYQDMTQPLSHYWIASSHNTYLVGNQLSGASSVEGYVDALKRGCRCVELDCWDGENDEPIVYHGYTLTTKILFKEILSDAIKPYAFLASRFPVILSLENHCSEPYQRKMAEYLKNILGDMLYVVDPDEDMEFLPSPEKLQGKVLVKAKKRSAKPVPPPRRKSSSSGVVTTEKEIDSIDGDSADIRTLNTIPTPSVNTAQGVDDGLLQSPTYANGPPKASMESLDDSDDSDPDESIDYIDGTGSSVRKKGVTTELSSLVNLIQAVHFHSFDDSMQSGKAYHMSSFAEAKALRLIEIQASQFVDYNKRQLSRIYPAGSRTSSSNFDPIDFWNVGCQIVALNYQTEDASNFYNFAKFYENGSCGYVLKPEILRNPKTKFHPKGSMNEKKGVMVKVEVISGQHIPKAPGSSEVVDPYTEIKVLGIPADRSKQTTKVVPNNGFNPVWEQSYSFRVYCPEVAMLYFRVKDHSQSGSDMPLGHCAVPFSSITTGYRHVHLSSLKGVALTPASLFIHITVKNVDGSPIK